MPLIGMAGVSVMLLPALDSIRLAIDTNLRSFFKYVMLSAKSKRKGGRWQWKEKRKRSWSGC